MNENYTYSNGFVVNYNDHTEEVCFTFLQTLPQVTFDSENSEGSITVATEFRVANNVILPRNVARQLMERLQEQLNENGK